MASCTPACSFLSLSLPRLAAHQAQPQQSHDGKPSTHFPSAPDFGSLTHGRQFEHTVLPSLSMADLSTAFTSEEPDMAMRAAEELDKQGSPISREAIYCLLRESTRRKDLAGGQRVYSLMVSSGLDSLSALGDHLIRLFASCRTLQDANVLFCKLLTPTIHTWQAIMSAYAAHGEFQSVLQCYHLMLQEGFVPNRFIYPCVLKASGHLRALEEAALIHNEIVHYGLELDTYIGNTLVDMYANCGSLCEARKMFDDLLNRDVVSWNSMIEGYAQQGYSAIALELFERMKHEGIEPNKVSFLAALKACSLLGDVDEGRLIHKHISRIDLKFDLAVQSRIVHMYAKWGSLEEAHNALDEFFHQDVVAWNAVLVGLVKNGHCKSALEHFEKMQDKELILDEVTYSCTLKACGILGSLAHGNRVHEHLIGRAVELVGAIGSSLVDMYIKCGSLERARKVFDNLPRRSIVSWGAMISGYTNDENGIAALDLYEKMQKEGIGPNKVILLCVLKACMSVGAIEQGKLIHLAVIRSGLESDVAICSTLVELYARGGCLEEAQELFYELGDKDVIAWGVMIGAYARHGKYELAGHCLKEMQKLGIKPDRILFTNILSACSHARKLEEGKQHFMSIRRDHGLYPDIEHLNCLVDLLGRTGWLHEAKELLEIMPFRTAICGWVSLLTACKTFSSVVLGRQCFDRAVSLDVTHCASYVIMTEIYADAQMWSDAYKVQELQKHARAWKRPGRAWIEVNKRVHEFAVGDQTHPQSADVYAKYNEVRNLINQGGCSPQLWDQKKDGNSALHCEKLAICFGLLTTAEGTTIRVTKNLRVCPECHSASKIIAKFERRQIVISDSYQVHNFEGGKCSCGS